MCIVHPVPFHDAFFTQILKLRRTVTQPSAKCPPKKQLPSQLIYVSTLHSTLHTIYIKIFYLNSTTKPTLPPRQGRTFCKNFPLSCIIFRPPMPYRHLSGTRTKVALMDTFSAGPWARIFGSAMHGTVDLKIVEP